jgi:uncharacterized protein YodC (DUF2158 family)
MKESFKIGDVVYLKSGSCAMTIAEILDGGEYKVRWQDNTLTSRAAVYHKDMLTKENPIPPPEGKASIGF